MCKTFNCKKLFLRIGISINCCAPQPKIWKLICSVDALCSSTFCLHARHREKLYSNNFQSTLMSWETFSGKARMNTIDGIDVIYIFYLVGSLKKLRFPNFSQDIQGVWIKTVNFQWVVIFIRSNDGKLFVLQYRENQWNVSLASLHLSLGLLFHSMKKSSKYIFEFSYHVW